METTVETKKHQRFTKRRERKTPADQGSADEVDESSCRPGKDKRSKPRRKKHNTIIEEDIIDGFAIISFKTFEDLEVSVQNTACNTQPPWGDLLQPIINLFDLHMCYRPISIRFLCIVSNNALSNLGGLLERFIYR